MRPGAGLAIGTLYSVSFTDSFIFNIRAMVPESGDGLDSMAIFKNHGLLI